MQVSRTFNILNNVKFKFNIKSLILVYIRSIASAKSTNLCITNY